jgi:hypothetical protein
MTGSGVIRRFHIRRFIAARAREYFRSIGAPRFFAGPWAFYKLRDGGTVPLICPTCQNVFAGSLKASMPATTMLLCMGLFSIF